MPLIALRCLNGHVAEQYVHTPDDRGAETRICACGETFAPTLSVGRGLTWFESGRARVIMNLGPEPVTVTSHGQHRQLLRERKLDWSTGWSIKGTGGWT